MTAIAVGRGKLEQKRTGGNEKPFLCDIVKVKNVRFYFCCPGGFMIKILFVCHGNICRSPMAEFVMKDIIAKAGREDDFSVSGAAAHTDELGNDMYPPVKKLLLAKNISFTPRAARLFTAADYENNDYIIAMDEANERALMRYTGNDREKKVSLLLSWCGENRGVADPWYTGDYETAYRDIKKGCTALFSRLADEK